MRDVVIVSGARTAVGNFGGALKRVPATELGAICIRESFLRAGCRPVPNPEQLELPPSKLRGQGLVDLETRHRRWEEGHAELQVDEVLMGNVVAAGQGQNPARQASIYAGLPKEVPATTINKVCASGMKAVALAAQAIRLGEADAIVAGGTENMSMIPYALPKARWGARMNDAPLTDLMIHDGLWETFYGYHMGLTAENIVELYGISRQEQDELSVESHCRALRAISDHKLDDEIVPVIIPQRRGDPIVFETDERPMETSLEKMSRLRPAFKKDGTVTAGNASGINDGAAAMLLMSRTRAEAMGLAPLATVLACAAGAVDPAYMGLGPVPAVHRLLRKVGWSISEVDYFELNEAFASQALACLRDLEIPLHKVNANGSGISIGHPIGATGARITLGLAMEMKRKGHKRGVAALCIGGGMGFAIALER